jgi:anti-sigma regulatory factor (Ser/Thr protein kinase)
VTPYLDVPVTEASQVGEARRAAQRLAAGNGYDELTCGRIGIVATELGTNLARHAQHGRLLIGCHAADEGRRFEIISIDRGPGMSDVNRCLRDGYSTHSTPGTGLGAVKRLSTDFSVYSIPGRGSVILSRQRAGTTDAAPSHPVARPRIAWAGVALAAPGEIVSGDGWALRLAGGRASAVLADGLGHGPVAAEASDAGLVAFHAATGAPSAVLERAHLAMRQTRGAAMAMVEIDVDAAGLVFAGAGNISARIISGVEDRTLLSQHGTLGAQIRRLQDTRYAWPDHALVLLHSDGVATRWNLAEDGGLLQCDPAVVAGWLLRDHARGRDDATVVVLKRT